jgi:putative inorganic carbon (HCO3(-)) transporter
VNSTLLPGVAQGPRPGTTAQIQATPRVPQALVAAVAVLAAVVAARSLANGNIAQAVAVVLGAAYLGLVFIDLAAAIAVWAGLLFIVHLRVLSVAPTAIEILLLIGWLGTAGTRRARLPVLREHRLLVGAIALCATWLTISIIWAEKPGKAAISAGYWWEAALAFVIVATTIVRPRDVRMVAVAFVIGAVFSVALGLLGIGGSINSVTAPEIDTRLVGGGGDPNYQAAAFLAAMFVAGGLIGVFSRPRVRFALSLALAFITVGFFATQSRGGALALAFALLAAFVLLPRQRARVLGWTMIAAAGLVVYLQFQPSALDRLTHLSGGGSGRQDVWTVAWRIFRAHPLIGIGLDNFTVFEPRYALDPGRLTDVRVVAETPVLVHNTYLQLLVETGPIGLIVLLIVALGSLRASWLAARRFDALGRGDYGNLARAVLIGTIGMLAANFFISNGNNFQLWILFALGPVMLTLAKSWPVERSLAARPAGRAAIERLPARNVRSDHLQR